MAAIAQVDGVLHPIFRREGRRMDPEKPALVVSGMVWVLIAFVAGGATAALVAWLISLC